MGNIYIETGRHLTAVSYSILSRESSDRLLWLLAQASRCRFILLLKYILLLNAHLLI